MRSSALGPLVRIEVDSLVGLKRGSEVSIGDKRFRIVGISRVKRSLSLRPVLRAKRKKAR